MFAVCLIGYTILGELVRTTKKGQECSLASLGIIYATGAHDTEAKKKTVYVTGAHDTEAPKNLGETANFPPFHFSRVYKRLANMISQKRQHPYPTVMGWLRCRLSFASLRSAIMCIRGSRSSFHRPVHGVALDITLATTEGRVPT